MKNVRHKIIFFILFMSMATLLTTKSLHSENSSNRFYSKIKHWLRHTPLVPGWQTTSQQKKEARTQLIKLLADKDALEHEITEDNNLTEEQIQAKVAQIALIKKNIHQQKVLLGEEWSDRRKMVVNTAKLAIGSLLGVISFSLGYHLLETNRVDPQIALQLAQSLKTHNPFDGRKVRYFNLPFTKKPNYQYKWTLITSNKSETVFVDTNSIDPEKTLFYDFNAFLYEPIFTLYACSNTIPNDPWHKVIIFRPYNQITQDKVELAPEYKKYISIP